MIRHSKRSGRRCDLGRSPIDIDVNYKNVFENSINPQAPQYRFCGLRYIEDKVRIGDVSHVQEGGSIVQ